MKKIFAWVTITFLMLPFAVQAQVPLSQYADKNGYLDIQALTCAQLANTFEEDAIALGTWYSGWYNGLAKKHYADLPRIKEGVHELIVYCKANHSKKIIEAIDIILKRNNDKK